MISLFSSTGEELKIPNHEIRSIEVKQQGGDVGFLVTKTCGEPVAALFDVRCPKEFSNYVKTSVQIADWMHNIMEIVE
jgi:hypothetical protein